MIVDLTFSVVCPHALPADHGYLLYSAISRALPEVHQADGFGIHPIRGRQLGGRTLQPTEASRLVIRTEAEHIARFLPLAGKPLQLLDRTLRVGVPEIRSLVPATTLRSRLVTIKLPQAMADSSDAATEAFRAAVLRQLGALGVGGSVGLCLGKRRTLRIKDKEVVGYEMLLDSLSAEESLAVQEHGLGGRRHMGCGIFVPFVARGGGQ